MLYINPEHCRNRETRESFQGLKQAKFQRKEKLKQFSLVFFLLLASYIGVNSRELKHITNEVEVNAPASEAWELYRNLGLIELAAHELKNVIQSVEVLKGDGGVGTVVRTTFVPGTIKYPLTPSFCYILVSRTKSFNHCSQFSLINFYCFYWLELIMGCFDMKQGIQVIQRNSL